MHLHANAALSLKARQQPRTRPTSGGSCEAVVLSAAQEISLG